MTAGEITCLCGYLPLAIGMLARQLHHHPAWTTESLAADLTAARDRLELMQAENLSVAAAFDLSYQDLSEAQRRLFRRLGLHPGPNIDAYAAAALDDTSMATARRQLGGLYDQHLIAEPARGRYRLHDLLREHARALAATDDPADCDAAVGRLLDYYLHGAMAAGRHIATGTPAARRRPPGDPPAWVPQLSTREQATAWLEIERPNLHAATGYAAASALPRHAIAILAAIGGFLRVHGNWDQSAALQQTALTAARQAGDRPGQADILHELGVLAWLAGNYQAAAAGLTRALAVPAWRDRLPSTTWASQQTQVYAAAAATRQHARTLRRPRPAQPPVPSNWHRG